MNTTDHLSQDDLATFALQLLPEAETRAALAHMQDCDDCRHAVAEFQGDLGIYSLGSELHAVPAGARERLLLDVAQSSQREGAKRTATVATSSESFAHSNGAPPASSAARADIVQMPSRAAQPRRRAGVLTWTGWALAAGFAGLAALQFQDRRQVEDTLTSERAQLSSLQDKAAVSQEAVSTMSDPAALNVTLRETASRPGQPPEVPHAHATYLPDRGALVFVASKMEPLQPYKVYELWLLPASGDQSPIPAASFRPDAAGNANVVLPTGPKLLSIRGFGVTVEDGKTPPHKPTLPILMMGSSKA